MGSIFGKKSKSKSENRAYEPIQQWASGLTPMTQYGADGMQDLLSGDTSGFDAYKGATGFERLLGEGSRGITGSAAARGLLRSGGTGRALVNYGNQMQDQYAGSYMDRLGQLAGIGTNAAQILGGVGNVSTSTGGKPGLGGVLGAGLAGAASGGISGLFSKKG